MQRLDQIGRLFRRGSDPPQRARRQRVSTQDVVRAFDGEPFALEHGQYLPQQGVVALLTYVEEETDGFLILVRDSKPGDERSFSTLLNAAVNQIAHILGEAFEHRGLDPELAVLYGQALVGMVATTAQWWLDEREPSRETVAAHIVNLCWNGLSGMEAAPKLKGAK